jgi:hypothetical protein
VKKVIGIALIIVGIAVGIFVRLDVGIAIGFVGALLVSSKLLDKLTEKKR